MKKLSFIVDDISILYVDYCQPFLLVVLEVFALDKKIKEKITSESIQIKIKKY